MGLFGALFAGVSGLGSQSNKIGIISDNIANVNTVGFKQGSAAFNTLVVPSGSTNFSPGGVIGNTQHLVSQQGLIQATSSTTDVAITGNGFFTVNTKADGSGSLLLSRAGSFTQDSSGNFINANGFYLQGIPVTNPATSVNINNLKTVNVNQSATGAATATSHISLAANFNAAQSVLLGSGVLGTMNSLKGTSAVNVGVTGQEILVGNDISSAGTASNNMVRGSTFNITSGSTPPVVDTFTYGGFTIGRDITSATSNNGDGGFGLVEDSVNAGNMTATNTGTTTTYSAMTGINLTSTSIDGVAAGIFTAGNTVSVGNITVTIGATETLTQLATALQAALQARATDGGSTATITGNAGNYSIVVQDLLKTSAGFTGTAFTTGTPTYTAVAAVNTPAASQVTIPVSASTINNYILGQNVDITGATAVGNIGAGSINGERKIVGLDVVNHTITIITGGTALGNSTGTSGTTVTVTNRSYPFTGNILNATSETSDFLSNGTSPLLTSNFSPESLQFSISVGGNTPVNFSYSATPDPASGTFNSLRSLAAAISNSPGLTARVQNGRLYVSATDATQSVTFTNGDAVGNGTLPGIDWTQELDLTNIPASSTTVHRFNSLSGLAEQINTVDPGNLVATVNNPNATATLSINEANPEQSVTFTDGNSTTSILKELGIANLTTNSGGIVTTGLLDKRYNPVSPNQDMSSGAITPQFSHDVTIYDAQGNAHILALNVAKIGTNTWAVELTAVPANSVHSTVIGPGFSQGDGQIVSGTVAFDGAGKLISVTGGLSSSFAINWTNGASASTINLDLGLGGTGGLSQSAAPFNVSLANQDGSPIGQLTGVSIDASGFVTETFSNGQTQKVYQLPLASVSNPNGLESVSGNAFQETLSSGQVNLNVAGTGGTGTIAPSALEQSNVDISTQLTNLIVAQQAYGANSKLLTVADQLLQQLDNIIQ